MKKVFQKLKEWMTDNPKEPTISFAQVIMHKGPTISAAAQIQQEGFPFHIEWNGMRHDN